MCFLGGVHVHHFHNYNISVIGAGRRAVVCDSLACILSTI